MIDTPQITQGPAKLTATIHLIIPRSKIRLIMGPGISELMAVAVVKAQGIRLAGPWFTHVVLTAPLSLWPPRWPASYPPSKVARTVYHGPYEDLGVSGEFNAWIAANGHDPRRDIYECYIAGRQSRSNAANWPTGLKLDRVAWNRPNLSEKDHPQLPRASQERAEGTETLHRAEPKNNEPITRG